MTLTPEGLGGVVVGPYPYSETSDTPEACPTGVVVDSTTLRQDFGVSDDSVWPVKRTGWLLKMYLVRSENEKKKKKIQS